jgi:hypothetical protein
MLSDAKREREIRWILTDHALQNPQVPEHCSAYVYPEMVGLESIFAFTSASLASLATRYWARCRNLLLRNQAVKFVAPRSAEEHFYAD